MDTLLSRLILYINTCIKKDVIYEISCYVIRQYSRCNEITVKDIMGECFVSRASVMRFCEYFGFHNWSDFQSFLIKTKLVKEQQLVKRFSKLDVDELYDHLAYIAKDDRLDFRQKIKDEINRLVTLVYQSKRIFLFGAIYPLSLGIDFQVNMISIGKLVWSSFQSNDIGILLEENDLAMILTASGRYIGECRAKFNVICNSPAKKVVLTCSNQYQSLQYLDEYFYVPKTSTTSFNAFDYYVMLILDLVFIEYHNRFGGEQ